MTDAVAAAAAQPATKWWLDPAYRDQFAGTGEEGGQMSPKTWENRPDEAERFKKFMAGLNPLHHIPGVGQIYREMTGETLEPGQQILGGALFGGITGLVSGLINAVVQHATGKDIGGNLMAAVKGDNAAETAAAIAPAASGPPVALIDAAAMPAVTEAEAPPAPLPKPAETAAATPQKLAENTRWYPTRGRDNARGTLNMVAPTPSPTVMALSHTRPEGRLPAASASMVTPGAGAGAYNQALELSRELQRHYLNMGVRDGLTESAPRAGAGIVPQPLLPQPMPATP